MNQSFPHFIIEGSPEKRGHQYGKLLADRIHRTTEFYLQILRAGNVDAFRHAAEYLDIIRRIQPDFAVEMEAIAAGADIHPLAVVALNARSELLDLAPNECTSVFFDQTGLLGQNWDYAAAMEDLVVVLTMHVERNLSITMLIEPGMIGKIGMNSSGVGVCLNMLHAGKPLHGMPIHCLLRTALHCRSVAEARTQLHAAGTGQAGNILVADSHGACMDFEFAGDQTLEITPSRKALIHTNHYLAIPDPSHPSRLQSSLHRLDTATRMIPRLQAQDLGDMKTMLLDQSNPDYPICRPYRPHPSLGQLGTVCTILMDLKKRKLHIRRGNTPDRSFVEYPCL